MDLRSKVWLQGYSYVEQESCFRDAVSYFYGLCFQQDLHVLNLYIRYSVPLEINMGLCVQNLIVIIY